MGWIHCSIPDFALNDQKLVYTQYTHRAYLLKVSWEFAYLLKIADPPPPPRGGFDTGISPKVGKSLENAQNTLFFGPAALFLAYYHNRVYVH